MARYLPGDVVAATVHGIGGRSERVVGRVTEPGRNPRITYVETATHGTLTFGSADPLELVSRADTCEHEHTRQVGEHDVECLDCGIVGA